ARQFPRQTTEIALRLLSPRRSPRQAGSGPRRLGFRHGGLQVLEGELTRVRAQLLGSSAVECLSGLLHEMRQAPALLAERRQLLPERCFLAFEHGPARALGFDEGAQLGRERDRKS